MLYNRPMTTTPPDSAAELKQQPFAASAGEHVRAVQAALVDLLAEAGLSGRASDEGWERARPRQDAGVEGRPLHGGRGSRRRRTPHAGSGGVEILLKGVRKKGIDAEQIDAVRQADRDLRSFMEQHAGDARSFEAMLASGGRDERIESEERAGLLPGGLGHLGRSGAGPVPHARAAPLGDRRRDARRRPGFRTARFRAPPPGCAVDHPAPACLQRYGKGLQFEREPLDPAAENRTDGAAVPGVLLGAAARTAAVHRLQRLGLRPDRARPGRPERLP